MLTAVIVGSCRLSENPTEVASEDILSTFALDPEFQIELLAMEPFIADPVAMEIDEYGRLYVVEMHGYPLDKSGTGKVKLLTDTNGDGQIDNSTIFADGLMLPTGIMRWKKGVLVTDPPHVLYLEDSDGDGKADIRNIMLTGFAVSNPQHNVNNPLLGIDNWIYLGHEQAVTAQIYKEEFGDRGSDIHYPAREESPRLPDNATGRSVRFRPDDYKLETISANTQFGHTFDAWGRHLMVSNANHIYHEVIAAPYLNRAPDLLVSDATQSISDHGTAAEVFPITRNPEHQLLTDVGVFTSACGITAYSGGIFPTSFENVTFVAEPVSNLVHVDLIKDKGATFTASRLYDGKEFLTSTDAWFRPVNMYIGPDGALYVIDYYRQFIEHPEWMAEEVVKSGALYNGKDKGRIYRITPKGIKPATWAKDIKLGDATNGKLVELLADPNIWWRRHAQRLLLDRNNKEVVPALEKMVSNATPLGRLHALWTLEGLHELKPETIKKALQDPVPGIRENAIKLAEPFLKAETGLTSNLLELKNDADAKVKFQLLSTLGFIDTPEAALAREELLFRDIEDPWIQIAALSAPSLQTTELLEAAISRYQKDIPAYASLVQRLSTMAGASASNTKLKPLIQKATREAPEDNGGWQASVLAGLAEGLKNKKDAYAKLEPERKILVKASFDHPASSVRQAGLQLLKVIGLPKGPEADAALQRAVKLASNTAALPERRTEAIQFLSLSKFAQYEGLFKKLIAPHEPMTLQKAAMQALSAIPGQSVSHYILENWAMLTPEIRDAAINSFFVNEERISLLLDAIEQEQVDPASIGWRRSVRLMSQSDKTLRDRARGLLTQKDEERQSVVTQYKAALAIAGNLENGKSVYQKSCAMCHQFAGENGVKFGPDLGTIRNRRPENIMADILDPNLSIADGHDMWLIDLKSGESIQGLIASETPTALTIRNYGGEETIILRSDIQALKALGMSAMPAGLEKQINEQEMADLLAFLKNMK